MGVELLKTLEAETEQARNEYGKLKARYDAADKTFTELFWLLATGIENQQTPTVTAALTKIARADELDALPWKSGLSDFLPILRKFYLDGAAESDRARTVKALEKNIVYKVARRNEYHQYLTDAVPETALDAADVEQTFRRFLTAYQWVETNRERIEAARLKWKEAKEALSAAKREAEIEKQYLAANHSDALGSSPRADGQTATKYPTAARTGDRRKPGKPGSRANDTAPPVEPKRYGGKQTTLIDGQQRGRVW
ncbi:MAG: hypothetical protein IKE69_02700 [Thermoguttaceae bacterium]|nr:hypothetical protein [Thermoguttaceae bacterium]